LLPIYHLTTEEVWRAAQKTGDLRAESLETEGFIHCSQAHQVLWVVDRFFGAATELLLVCIDGERLGSSLVFEPPGGDARSPTESFPHVYGTIPSASVVAVGIMKRDAEGGMCWPVRWEPCSHNE
jgi:uncharacterized protein (DUF952 family)